MPLLRSPGPSQRCASAQAAPEFSMCTGSPVRSTRPDLYVAPAELGGVEHASAAPIHHPGDYDPDPFTVSSRRVGSEQAANAHREFVQQLPWVENGPKTLERQLVPAEVREQQVRPAETDIDRHDEPIAGLHVQHLRPATTWDVGKRALVNGTFCQQLLDHGCHHATSHRHAAGEIGSGDRLKLAHEGQPNQPVYLSGSGT